MADTDPLTADCSSCAGLCCVAPAFSASADFAIDKEPGSPCPHLGPGFRCGIHATLRTQGFAGCAVFDCFGAGQRVTQRTFEGANWRDAPGLGSQMFRVFGVMRSLHQGLWLLREARRLNGAAALNEALQAASERLEHMAAGNPTTLAALDLLASLGPVRELLVAVSARVRSRSPGPRADHRGADLVGADLRKEDLRGADLRGAQLLGARLDSADLSLADLTGADLRGARLDGAQLSRALFLSQSQLDAATGDAGTELPDSLGRPAHWR